MIHLTELLLSYTSHYQVNRLTMFLDKTKYSSSTKAGAIILTTDDEAKKDSFNEVFVPTGISEDIVNCVKLLFFCWKSIP